MSISTDLEFKPDLTPAEMLALGVFGGAYFAGFPEMQAELPATWLTGAILSEDGSPRKECNYFGVLASQPLEVWQKKGWIHPADPLGWFQWYCRYYQGRRIPAEDARQIKRWKAIRRHAAAVQRNCRPGDVQCRPRQRQALLHWAYDSRSL